MKLLDHIGVSVMTARLFNIIDLAAALLVAILVVSCSSVEVRHSANIGLAPVPKIDVAESNTWRTWSGRGLPWREDGKVYGFVCTEANWNANAVWQSIFTLDDETLISNPEPPILLPPDVVDRAKLLVPAYGEFIYSTGYMNFENAWSRMLASDFHVDVQRQFQKIDWVKFVTDSYSGRQIRIYDVGINWEARFDQGSIVVQFYTLLVVELY